MEQNISPIKEIVPEILQRIEELDELNRKLVPLLRALVRDKNAKKRSQRSSEQVTEQQQQSASQSQPSTFKDTNQRSGNAPETSTAPAATAQGTSSLSQQQQKETGLSSPGSVGILSSTVPQPTTNNTVGRETWQTAGNQNYIPPPPDQSTRQNPAPYSNSTSIPPSNPKSRNPPAPIYSTAPSTPANSHNAPTSVSGVPAYITATGNIPGQTEPACSSFIPVNSANKKNQEDAIAMMRIQQLQREFPDVNIAQIILNHVACEESLTGDESTIAQLRLRYQEYNSRKKNYSKSCKSTNTSVISDDSECRCCSVTDLKCCLSDAELIDILFSRMKSKKCCCCS